MRRRKAACMPTLRRHAVCMQGCAWDPASHLLATQSADRTCRWSACWALCLFELAVLLQPVCVWQSRLIAHKCVRLPQFGKAAEAGLPACLASQSVRPQAAGSRQARQACSHSRHLRRHRQGPGLPAHPGQGPTHRTARQNTQLFHQPI